MEKIMSILVKLLPLIERYFLNIFLRGDKGGGG